MWWFGSPWGFSLHASRHSELSSEGSGLCLCPTPSWTCPTCAYHLPSQWSEAGTQRRPWFLPFWCPVVLQGSTSLLNGLLNCPLCLHGAVILSQELLSPGGSEVLSLSPISSCSTCQPESKLHKMRACWLLQLLRLYNCPPLLSEKSIWWANTAWRMIHHGAPAGAPSLASPCSAPPASQHTAATLSSFVSSLFSSWSILPHNPRTHAHRLSISGASPHQTRPRQGVLQVSPPTVGSVPWCPHRLRDEPLSVQPVSVCSVKAEPPGWALLTTTRPLPPQARHGVEAVGCQRIAKRTSAMA